MSMISLLLHESQGEAENECQLQRYHTNVPGLLLAYHQKTLPINEQQALASGYVFTYQSLIPLSLTIYFFDFFLW